MPISAAEIQEITREVKQIGPEFKRRTDELTERMDMLETAFKRSPVGSPVSDDHRHQSTEVKAFNKFLARGPEALDSYEVKALAVGDGPSGGFLAPNAVSTELVRKLQQFSPLRSVCRVQDIGNAAIELPRLDGRPTARWVGELEDRTETAPVFGSVTIPAYEQAAYIDVSNKLLEDAIINIGDELASLLAVEFGRLEGAAFISGDGVEKPRGVLSYPTTDVAQVVSGSATTLTADGLIDLAYALPTFYRDRGHWCTNSQTLRVIRKFKDGTGQYLWAPGIGVGEPQTLLGRPIVECPDMPDIAASATPIVFGDFSSAYHVVDRIGLTILRDPFTIATKGQTRFHARRRVGGGLVLPEALRKQVISA